MPQPLVPTSWRRAAATLAVLAALLVLGLSVALHGVNDTSFDTWIALRLDRHVGVTAQILLLGLSTSGLTFGMLAFVVAGALLARAWNVVALAVVGPLVAVGLTEIVLKPAVHRVLVPAVGGFQLPAHSFPSGHETGLAAMLTVVALLLARVQWGWVGRVVGYGVLVLWALAGAAGLVRAYYHFPTDTIGGIGVAVACVLAVAFAVDAVVARVDRTLQIRQPAGVS